jgi:hypothetical protein
MPAYSGVLLSELTTLSPVERHRAGPSSHDTVTRDRVDQYLAVLIGIMTVLTPIMIASIGIMTVFEC